MWDKTSPLAWRPGDSPCKPRPLPQKGAGQKNGPMSTGPLHCTPTASVVWQGQARPPAPLERNLAGTHTIPNRGHAHLLACLQRQESHHLTSQYWSAVAVRSPFPCPFLLFLLCPFLLLPRDQVLAVQGQPAEALRPCTALPGSAAPGPPVDIGG